MADRKEDSDTARLEVLKYTSAPDGEEDCWKDAGSIQVADGADRLTDAVASAGECLQKDGVDGMPPLSTRDSGRRRKKPLPRRVKLLLSPNAKIKSDRRANFLYRHSPDGIDTNLLVLLHGAGDSHVPYDALAQRMALPQTAALSLSASSFDSGFKTLPFGLGCTWFEEMDYSSSGDVLQDNDPRRVQSLDQATEKLCELIDLLVLRVEAEGSKESYDDDDEGWIPERIFLFGFSSGACLTMETCLKLILKNRRPLGGAVCVAGGVKCDPKVGSKSSTGAHGCGGTPILILAGSKDKTFPTRAATNAAKIYHGVAGSPLVQVFVKNGREHGMIGSQEEMRCMMEFLAQKMVRRMMGMEGWREVKATSSKS